MTTDSALRELVARLRNDLANGENYNGYTPYEKGKIDERLYLTNQLESILTAAGEARGERDQYEDDREAKPPTAGDVEYARGYAAGMCDGQSIYGRQPAPAGMVLVPRELTLEMYSAFNSHNGEGVSFHIVQDMWDKMLYAAPTTPPPTLNEAFDQAGAAMRREVSGEGAPAAQETRADGAIKCNACGGWNKPWQPGHIDCCDHYSAPAAQVPEEINPDSRNFKAGMTVGQSCEQALADKIRNPVCDRCGARNADEAAAKCSSAYDDCPGTEFPLSHLWELSKAAAPAVVVDEAAREAIESILWNLQDWGKAYPLDLFPEPESDDLKWLHATKRGLCDRISASMGRHIANLIEKDLSALAAALKGGA